MDTLGKRIEHAISASGISVQDAARICGVSVQAIYIWMRDGVKDLRNENLFTLADATGFDARWIAIGEGVPQPALDKEKSKLDRLYLHLDERGKQAVLMIAEAQSAYTPERDKE